MNATGIHHVALTVNDWEASKAFYTEVLGAMGAQVLMDLEGPPHKDPDGRLLVLGAEGFMVTVWEASPEHRGNRFRMYNVGLHHAAFAAPSREAVDALHEVLVGMDADVLDPPREYGYVPGYYATYFRDPDGIKLEYVHVPAAE